jgi:hypothetical protein
MTNKADVNLLESSDCFLQFWIRFTCNRTFESSNFDAASLFRIGVSQLLLQNSPDNSRFHMSSTYYMGPSGHTMPYPTDDDRTATLYDTSGESSIGSPIMRHVSVPSITSPQPRRSHPFKPHLFHSQTPTQTQPSQWQAGLRRLLRPDRLPRPRHAVLLHVRLRAHRSVHTHIATPAGAQSHRAELR